MDERPRERMLQHGAASLSNAELLSVMLRTGTKEMNVIDVARLLMEHSGGSLAGLHDMSVENMCRIPGIGRGKALQMAAAFELARRMAVEKAGVENMAVRSPYDAFMNLAPHFTGDRLEECMVLFLKGNMKVLGRMLVSKGSETSTSISTKNIIRRALELGARALILSHNHPSGDPRPSKEDIRLTEELQDAARAFDLQLMDHIIISPDSYFSFSKNEEYAIGGKKCNKV